MTAFPMLHAANAYDRGWHEAIEAAAKVVANTRFYEGDGHMDAGIMLALAVKNVEALKKLNRSKP